MSATMVTKIVEKASTPISEALNAELEAELKIFQKLQEEQKLKYNFPQVDSTKAAAVFKTPEEQKEADARSIFINNVHFCASGNDLERHFEKCGKVARVTILKNKFTGKPKGAAYLEFAEKENVKKALQLSNSVLLNRRIVVSEKRTNLPRFAGNGGKPVYAGQATGAVNNRYRFCAEGYAAKIQSNRAKTVYKPY